MSKQSIQLSSRFRATDSISSADYILRYTTPLRVEGKRWRLVQAIIPNTMYIITSANQIINITDNLGAARSTTATVGAATTIPIGVYNPTDLCTAVATALTAVCAAFTAEVWTSGYTDLSMKALFSSTGAASVIRFLTGANAGANNNIWRILGFTSANGFAAVDALQGTTPAQLVNVATPLCFNITVSINGHDEQRAVFDNGQQRATFILPNTAGNGELMLLVNNELQHCEMDINDDIINEIHVRLWGDAGETLDLLGADWSLLISQM